MSDISPTSELHELDEKIRKAREFVRAAERAATWSARESMCLTALESERSAMVAEMKRKQAAQSPDLPGLWTWSDDGEAVNEDGVDPVYVDGDGCVCFESDDWNAYRPIEVVRAVLARHDAAELD